MRYFYVPGKYNPYWWITEEGAGNKETDTKPSMSAEDFARFFPRAFEISQEQYESENIHWVHGVQWATFVKMVEKAQEK
jgi:hypothetical protein